MSDYVKRFMEAVYPDAPNLAMAAFNEEKVLTDAADKIASLRARLEHADALAGALKEAHAYMAHMRDVYPHEAYSLDVETTISYANEALTAYRNREE